MEKNATSVASSVSASKRKPKLMVKSYKLIDFHTFDADGHFQIQMFGINEMGKTCSILITDYQPFFFVKVGDHWTDQDARLFLIDIRNRVGYHMGKDILSAQLVKRNKLYGFTGGNTHKFVQLTFSNMGAFNKAKGLWYKYENNQNDGNSTRIRNPYLFRNSLLELYESSIPPLLRYFHIYNISPSGWVFVPIHTADTPETPRTTCDTEYICSIVDLKPAAAKESLAPYKICSFDIEASSSHGDFPVPIKTYKRFAANMVDVFQKQAEMITDTTLLGNLLKRSVLTAFGYDAVEDIDIVYPKTAVSKEQAKRFAESVLRTSVEEHSTTQSDILPSEMEEKKKLLSISKIFEKMKETKEEGVSEGTDDDEEDDIVETSPYSPTKNGKQVKHVKPAGQTILDVLLDKKGEYDRDTKIQKIDESLTLLLPLLEGDKVTFIGSTFLRYGESQPYLNHCLALGSCAPVAGAEIESKETEAEVLLGWTELIQRENPDIIIGYNIFGFDYEFLYRRAQENHCERDFFVLSRIRDELTLKENLNTCELTMETTKIALASGEYELRFPKLTGRLQIDLYTYFRRDFNLPSYKLDDVAGQFISDDIKRIIHNMVDGATELWTGNVTGLNVGDFIHLEICGFTSDYFMDGRKFPVIGMEKRTVEEVVKGKATEVTYSIIKIAGHDLPMDTKSIKWGMAKDDVSPQDIFRLSNGSAEDRAIVAKYCIQDCNLVHHLMNKIDVMTGYVEMSRICSVPISFLIFRGQGIKLTSYVAKKCRDKNTLMPDLDKSGSNEGYEGAIVLPPKCAMYMDNPVACVDYASLYPSSMISQNYSHDSKVWTKEYDLEGNLIRETGERDISGNYIYDNLPTYQYINIEFDTYRQSQRHPKAAVESIRSGKKVCRWAQLPNHQKSIMPSILEELLKARADTRKLIKTEKDPFMQNILDKRQLGYKVTANSLYGQCGARTSTFYEKDVAASTTATGRMMITYARRMIEEVYGDLVYDTECHGPLQCRAEYVYGDTDSVFFTFNLEDPKTKEKVRGKKALEATIEIAQDTAQLCTQFLKSPMELAYEKTLMPFILLSKKRYVGMLYETDPNKGKLKYMGLSLKRRDACDYLKDTYGGVLNILMKENRIDPAIQFLEKSLEELIQGRVSMDKLCITRALRSDYKNPQQIAHKVLADRIAKRDPGNKPKPGERMKFVFVVNQEQKKALLGDRIETPAFIKEHHLQIDYTYYMTNQLMKPLQQLFGLAVEQIWEMQGKRSAIKTYQKEVAKIWEEVDGDIEVFAKKREKLSSAKVKQLLFDKFLTKIFQQKHGIRQITDFFGKS
jgi:DNA polymerase elongation subunit (family B)